MKALVYLGPGQKEWREVPDPVIQKPTDVIVKMDTTTICGTEARCRRGNRSGRHSANLPDVPGHGPPGRARRQRR
jgi:threonine dehydrogenase-like Zn-dependent dehydrogenase